MSPNDDGEQITASGHYDDSHDQASQVGGDGYIAGGDQHIYIGGKPPKKRKPPTGKDSRRPRQRFWLAVGIVGAALLGVIAYLLVPGSSTIPLRTTSLPSLTTVQMAGSSPFFGASDVERELRRLGFVVHVTSLGSRQICTEPNLIATYDISDSGSEEAATCVENLVQRADRIPDSATPYEGPMVIMTYKPIVALLEQLHIAHQVNGITVFDVAKYLKVFASGERWTDIPGNTTYKNPNRILLSTTNPKQSDSGGMFVDIAYAAQTGGDTPTSIGPRDPHISVIRSLLAELGSLENHTPVLRNQFLASGMTADPMAMVSESDYVSAVLDGESQDPNLTVMYPTPDVLAADDFVAWTPAGRRLIEVLQSPQMAALEGAHGYRTVMDKDGFVKYMRGKGITVPDLDDLDKTLQYTNPPTEKILEELIDAVATSQPG